MKILIFGGGISNLALIRLLKRLEISFDIINQEAYYDYIVKPPGVKEVDCPKNGQLVTDIEMINILFKPEIIGITGTNGKTTTTLMIYEVLKSHIDVSLGGNIGIPFANIYDGNNKKYLLELSSFELEFAKTLKPKIAVILNCTKAHLDHHYTYENYLNSKLNICKNQNVNDYLIYNYDDENIKESVKNLSVNKLSSSLSNPNSNIYIYDNKLIFKTNKIDLDLIKYDTLFNLKNIMATILVCDLYGIDIYEIIDVVNNFIKPKYRLEKITDNIYNDAKSTNTYSTIEAVKALGKVNLIIGGYDRGDDFTSLEECLDNILECFIYGENRFKIYNFLKQYKIKCHLYKTLKNATLEALKRNGIILYSPASASFDQYSSYIERGIEFEDIIKERLKSL